jgi:hypothetical protein
MKRWTGGMLLLAATAGVTGAGLGGCVSEDRPERSYVPIGSGSGDGGVAVGMDGQSASDGTTATDGQSAIDGAAATDGQSAVDGGIADTGGDAASASDAPGDVLTGTEGGTTDAGDAGDAASGDSGTADVSVDGSGDATHE